MVIAGALLATACDDAPARPTPRPSAPIQASRALIGKVMSQAVADVEQAHRLAPPPERPAMTGVLGAVDTDRFADVLGTDDLIGRLDTIDPDVLSGRLSGLQALPDDDPDRDPDDDAVVGGVVGGVIDDPPAADVSVVLVSDADDVDTAVVESYRRILTARALVCRQRAIADGTLDADTRVVVSVSSPRAGSFSANVSGSGPLTMCIREFTHAALPPGTTLTFQLRVPAP